MSRGLAVAVSVVLLGSTAASAQADLPAVGIRFEIAASLYHQTVPDSIGAIESRLEDSVADLLTSASGLAYVSWKPLADADSVRGLLTLSVEEDSVFRDAEYIGSDIRLRYLAGAGREDLSFQDPDVFFPVLIAWWDDQHAHDPARFVGKVQSALASTLRSQEFQDSVQRHFLRGVKLSDEIQLTEGLKGVIVPVKWSALRAQPESKLRAEFKATADQLNLALPGTMGLTLQGGLTPAGYSEDVLLLGVNRFSFHDLNLEDRERLETAWNSISSVLQAADVTTIQVFMEEYRRNLNLGVSSGGIVTDL